MHEPTRDRIQRWVSLPRPRDEVWAEIGAFGALADWHPEVASVQEVEIAGEPHRHLTLQNGAVLLERLVETGAHHYTIEIVDSPLPLNNYRSTLSCVTEKGGCHVFWSALFEATDPSADDIVSGFFEIGLRALRERYPD